MKSIYRRILVALIVQLAGFISFAQQPLFKNRSLSPEVRARDLLSRMTLDEKVMQMQCFWGLKSKLLNDNGEFDEAKAAAVLKNGLGELARLNENAGPNSSVHEYQNASALQPLCFLLNKLHCPGMLLPVLHSISIRGKDLLPWSLPCDPNEDHA